MDHFLNAKLLSIAFSKDVFHARFDYTRFDYTRFDFLVRT